MENNQQERDLTTTVLAEICSDYLKEKKRARFLKYVYYGVMAIAFAWTMAMVSGAKKAEAAAVIDSPFVAVIDISGEIGEDKDISEEKYSKFIEDTFNNENVAGVVLQIDCPGGGVYDTSILYEKIMKMKSKYPEKKVTTYVKRVAASGGYWLSLAGDKIYTTPVSQVGSIGVFTFSVDMSEFLKEYKIHPYFIKAGKYKTMGTPTEPLTPEEKALIQGRIDDVYNLFINVVQVRRGDKLSDNPDLFTGLMWMGQKAVDNGLTDYADVGFEEMVTAEYGDYAYYYVEPSKPPFDLQCYLNKLMDKVSTAAIPFSAMQDPHSTKIIA